MRELKTFIDACGSLLDGVEIVPIGPQEARVTFTDPHHPLLTMIDQRTEALAATEPDAPASPAAPAR